MIVTAKAPTRIDLAGGTLDLWPIHCLFPGSITINAAINLYARVTIEKRKDRKIYARSVDTKNSFSASSLQSLKNKSGFELIQALIRFYAPESGFNLITHCEAPMGSGIAGSSALNIALNGAFNAFTGSRYSRKDMIEIAKNLEASAIRIPTGVQDYYPALYGGLNFIRFHPKGIKMEKMNDFLSDLEHKSILCYTGLSRFSGANNWEVFKKTIEGHKRVQEKIGEINVAANKLHRAIIWKNKTKIATAIEEEWQSRKGLAKGVSHPGIEKLIRAAKSKGMVSAKICGAGGGGCLYLYLLKGKREEIKNALREAGGEIINFKFVKKGLAVSVKS